MTAGKWTTRGTHRDVAQHNGGIRRKPDAVGTRRDKSRPRLHC